MDPQRYFPRPLPKPLQGLDDLAVDLRWSWNHSADALWERVDPELWQGTGDPWLILESVPHTRLEALACDPDFVARLRRQLAEREAYRNQPTWFLRTHADKPLGCVAYFSMEYTTTITLTG